MVGITVTAGVPRRAGLAELEEPERRDNELLVEALAMGVCGTDREIVSGVYGSAPPGRDWLVPTARARPEPPMTSPPSPTN